MPQANHRPLFDREAALARMGGDAELLKELAALFVEDYPRSLAKLHTALECEDTKAFQDLAHGMKGVVANFGAQAAVEAALSLEKLGREGRLGEAHAPLAELEQVLALLKSDLGSL